MPHAFSTQRLTLRPLGPQDAPSIARFVGDLDVARWLTRVPHPYGIEDAHAFIERSAGDEFTYAVIAQSTFAGVMSITDELGYWLGQPFWGRGYATEAANALVSHYFDAWDDDIQSGFVLGNSASRNVLEKLGFAPLDRREVVSASLGDTVTVQKMRLTRAAWEDM